MTLNSCEWLADLKAELDTRLRHKLHEREQLVHHLMQKLQRPESTAPSAGLVEQQQTRSQLLNACAQLEAVSRRLAVAVTLTESSRKHPPRVLFAGRRF